MTLHVGYGTFKPVRTEDVEEHRIHAEPFEIEDAAARRLRRRVARAGGRRVGTTTTRTLEAVAAEHGGIVQASGEASLYIYPGFRFQVAGGLLTNFHLPRSSLLLLVCAFAGPSVNSTPIVRDSRGLSLLQLRGCDADRVNCRSQIADCRLTKLRR